MMNNNFYKLTLTIIVVVCSYQFNFAQTTAEVVQTVVSTTSTMTQVDDPKADAIVGSWSFYDNKLSVKIFKEGNEYKGRIIWMKEPLDKNGLPLLDQKNPEKVHRSEPVLNMVNLYGFKYNVDDNMWEEGFIYNPLTGETIKGSLELLDNNHLEMTGFVGFSLALTTETWTRM